MNEVPSFLLGEHYGALADVPLPSNLQLRGMSEERQLAELKYRLARRINMSTQNRLVEVFQNGQYSGLDTDDC